MSGEFIPGGDGSEFEPAEPGQIEYMTRLVGNMLDGRLAIVSRGLPFYSPPLEGKFAHHWIARYDNDSGEVQPITDEHAAALPKPLMYRMFSSPFENNALSIDMMLGYGADYDAGSLEASIPLQEDHIIYTMTRESLHKEEGQGPLLREVGSGPESKANRGQAHSLRALLGLVIPEDILELDRVTAHRAQRIAAQFDVFEMEGRQDDPSDADTEDLHDIRMKLLGVLDQRNTGTEFVRRFGTMTEGCVVGIAFIFDRNGHVAKHYEVRTGIPATSSAAASSEVDESDVFVTVLRWTDGQEPEHREYFDVDINRVIEEKQQDPTFNFAEQSNSVFDEARAKKKVSEERFAEERADGFHIFSQAAANRLIRTLENPGEEDLPG